MAQNPKGNSRMRKILSYLLALNTFLMSSNAWPRTLTSAEKSEKLHQMSLAIFDLVAAQFMMVTSPEDYDQLQMLRYLPPRDRSEILRGIRHLKQFPTVYRRGDALVLEQGNGVRFEAEWLDLNKGQLLINGVAWTYKSSVPFLLQMERLTQKLKLKKTATNDALEYLFPKAHADACIISCPVLIGMFIGGILTVTFSDVVKAGWCNYIVEPVSLPSEQCANLKKSAEEGIFKNEPAFDAIVNLSGSGNKNVLAFFEAIDEVCPARNDGKAREYRGKIRSVELKDGKPLPLTDWFNVVVKINPDGNPTDLIVTAEGTDPKTLNTISREAREKLIVHIVFDPKIRKPVSYRIPDPNFRSNRDLLSEPTISLTPIMKLTPEQAQAVAKARDIVRVINYRNYNCVVKKVAEDQSVGIDPGSPKEPKVAPATTN